MAVSHAGAPLDGALRRRFEGWFDFSRVRIHADGAGARAADALKAQAFTYGRDIVFARGEYRPDSEASQRLIAHELAHVVQQSGAAGGGRATRGEHAGVGRLTLRPGAVASSPPVASARGGTISAARG